MSGPQFMHMETYQISVSKLRKNREVARAEEGKVVDRKLNVEEICGEAARTQGHCPHVEESQTPLLLFGISPDQVPALLNDRVKAANAAIRAKKSAMKRGTRIEGTRAIRNDTHTLVTLVSSHPIPWRNVDTGEANFDNPENRDLLDHWIQLNLNWANLKAEALGFELVSVVLHVDESYPHLHFIGIPEGERIEARRCHPGYAARDALEKEDGETDKQFTARRNRTYRNAMRAFQDDYYDAVSVDAGLLRTGPKRARLPNATYKAWRVAARAQGLASVRYEKLQRAIEEKQTQHDEARALLISIEDDTTAAIIDASEFEWQRERAKNALEEVQVDLQSYEAIQVDLQGIALERAREEAALEDLKREREECEARLVLKRQQDAQRAAELAAQLDELGQRSKELEEDKRKHAEEMAKQRAELAQTREELDAILEGVDAFADGRLQFRSNDEHHPFYLVKGKEGSDQLLDERLKLAKPRLVPILLRLDEAVEKRAKAITGALEAALGGWSKGLLRGLGAPREDGNPTFDIPNTTEGDLLVKQIEPHREFVARMISVLPDWRAIRAVKQGLARLSGRLSAIDRADESRLDEALTALWQSKSVERD